MIMYVIEHIGLSNRVLGWLRIVDDVRTRIQQSNEYIYIPSLK